MPARFIESALLLCAAVLVHAWGIIANGLFAKSSAFGDISLYNYWVYQLDQGFPIPGLQADWVYPALAFFPIWLPSQLPLEYQSAWLLLVFVLNASLALLLLFNRDSSKDLSSWWFLLSIGLLGPVAISRIDIFSVVLALLALVAQRSSRYKLAAAFLTFAGWIKVWPVALFMALATTLKNKSQVLVTAGSISTVFICLGLVVGGTNIFSFATAQQNRGLQIESVLATPWMWLATNGQAEVYFDESYLTNQIRGFGAEEFAAVSNLLLAAALIGVFLLAHRALRLGQNHREVYVFASAASVASLIVFNKVGSPQFMLWLVVPAIAASYFGVSRAKHLLGITGAILLLTQLIYPVFYIELLGLETFSLLLLTARNLLIVILLVVSSLALAREQTLK